VTIPDFQTLMLPILKAVGDGRPVPRRELANAMITEFSLTEAEREKTISSGDKVINNRTWWALTHLFQAGLLARPQRGVVEITDAGRAVLASPPARIDVTYLLRYPQYVEFRNRSKVNVPGPPKVPVDEDVPPESPEELIARALAENRAAVESDLLDRALAVEPSAFERLVLRLLEAMGYGKAGRIEHSGQTGDGGFDGIISQDPLGLDRVYMQAKRYARDNTVQRPAIQGFIGALFGAQGDRGVFITTSSFSAGARQEADRVNARIVLIDGNRLAELMVRHGVGVQAESTAVLHRVDEDFFDTL
jgi:restriction system protein